DGQTFETWRRDNLGTSDATLLIDLAIRAVFATEPRDLSLLFALFYIHSGGNLNRLTDTAGGAQESRVVGGSQRISLRMARELGRRVQLRQEVRSIEWKGKRAEVRTGREAWTCKQVVVAVAPALAARIRFSPPLPGASGPAHAADADGGGHQRHGGLPTWTARSNRASGWRRRFCQRCRHHWLPLAFSPVRLGKRR